MVWSMSNIKFKVEKWENTAVQCK